MATASGAFRPGRVTLALVGALTALGALGGCSAAPADQSAPPTSATSGDPAAGGPSCTAAPESPRDPVRVYFPDQGLRVDLTRVGLNAYSDFNLVPIDAHPLVAGWWCDSPQPGDIGPSVLVGHVDWGGSKAAFGYLSSVKVGARIVVTSRDGSEHTFTVDGKQRVGKVEFPMNRVFGDTPVAALRLITCGGIFDHGARSYVDSDILYANAATG